MPEAKQENVTGATSLEQTPPPAPPVKAATRQPPPAVDGYGKRFLRQVMNNTFGLLVTQQIITTFVLSVLGVIFSYVLGWIPEPTDKQTFFKQLLIIACVYVAILLAVAIVNMIRAPFILDRERNRIIVELADQLEATKQRLAEALGVLETRTLQSERWDAAAGGRNPQANLVLKRVRVIRTSIDRYVDEDEDGMVTAVVEFKNEADASLRISGAVVRAAVSFENAGGELLHEVPDGVWMRERSTRVKFRLNDVNRLAIAVQTGSGVKALEVRKKTLSLKGVKFTFHDLPPGEYNVVVHLLADRPSVSLGKFQFKLSTHPQFQFEPADVDGRDLLHQIRAETQTKHA